MGCIMSLAEAWPLGGSLAGGRWCSSLRSVIASHISRWPTRFVRSTDSLTFSHLAARFELPPEYGSEAPASCPALSATASVL
jgi:hypothetical protein